MTWVHRQSAVAAHTCDLPTHERLYDFPSTSLHPPDVKPVPIRVVAPLGQAGDLWRCPDCRKLWLIEVGCDSCTWHGYCGRHYAGLILRPVWMPARWWQRLIHLRR